MILLLAVGLWVLAFIVVGLVPRISHHHKRQLLFDLSAVGIIGVATAGFFWQILFTPNAWMPAGGGDLAGLIYPTYSFAARWIRQGVVPLWNPHQFAGAPFIGDIQSGIGYPLNLLTFLISVPLTYHDLESLSVLHFFIAGAGMYALLRFGGITKKDVMLSRPASMTGALAFEFSDLFVTHFGNLNLIAVAAWLPLIFLFFVRALDHRSGRVGCVAGLILGIAFLAGHIQPFLFILITLFLFAVFFGLASRANARTSVWILGVTLVVGLGVSAFVLFPSVEMAGQSVRNALPFEQAIDFSLPPAQLIGLLVPGFFGRGPVANWAPWPRVEVGYIGVFPILLAAIAVVLQRDSRTRFFALLAIIGLALALGGYSILFSWLYALVPGFGELRAPARFIYLMDFALAVLAAIGFDVLLTLAKAETDRKLAIVTRIASRIFLLLALFSAGIALSILILGQGLDPVIFARIANAVNSLFFFILLFALSLALLYSLRYRLVPLSAWSVLAVALVGFDLFSLGANVDISSSDPTAIFQPKDVLDFLHSQPAVARIDSHTDVEGSWRPEAASLLDLYDLYGDNPLVLTIFNDYWEALGGRDSKVYDALNSQFLLARPSTALPSKFRQAMVGRSGIAVYENPSALPRAWIVYSTRELAGESDILNLIRSKQLDAGSVAVFAGQPVESLAGAGQGMNVAKVVALGPNEIVIEADAKAQGYLILSEVYYPGWRAFVDGKEATVERADYLFRGVALPPGQHTVKLDYDPPLFKLGLGISILTLLGIALGAIFAWRQSQALHAEHLLNSRV